MGKAFLPLPVTKGEAALLVPCEEVPPELLLLLDEVFVAPDFEEVSAGWSSSKLSRGSSYFSVGSEVVLPAFCCELFCEGEAVLLPLEPVFVPPLLLHAQSDKTAAAQSNESISLTEFFIIKTFFQNVDFYKYILS